MGQLVEWVGPVAYRSGRNLECRSGVLSAGVAEQPSVIIRTFYVDIETPEDAAAGKSNLVCYRPFAWRAWHESCLNPQP